MPETEENLELAEPTELNDLARIIESEGIGEPEINPSKGHIRNC